MLIVAGIQFYEHRVWTRREVTFNNFRNLLKFWDDLLVHGATFQFYPDICTGVISQDFRIDMVSGSDNLIHVDDALNTLVNGRARHPSFLRYILERNPGIL